MFSASNFNISWWENIPRNPPSEFSLVSPIDETRSYAATVTFTWQQAIDPEDGDTVAYTFYLDDDDTFTEPLVITENITETTTIVEDLTDITQYWWKVKAYDQHGQERWSTETWTFFVILNRVTDENSGVIPHKYSIKDIYPNPFNPITSVVVGLPESAFMNLSLYNISGQKVAVLANGQYSSGYKQFTIDGSLLASGIYFVHMQVPEKVSTIRKVVLMK